MKKIYLIALFALICNFAMAQIERTTYQGAFAPAPTAMWTDSWTSWDPQSEVYADKAPALTDVAPANSNIVNVTADITTNTTWYATKTYKMSGLIYVRNNATLTIQAGTLIKGVYSSTGTALVITKGAKINAVGTATSPIVFTSAKAAGSRLAADWGGIILLGKAGFNLNAGVNNIEGITATANTEYGGGTTPIDDDNSGALKYVRIEYGGFVFSPNNEINGLTFGSVGRGTTIDYVQVSYSGDDSFEWFGGSVNCKHIVAYKGLDDDFDTDNGYKGIVQFALGIRDPSISDNPAVSTSEGFESDNNASTLEAATGYDNTAAIFTNCTLLGPSKRAAVVASGFARALRLRRSTELKIYNSIFLDFKNNYAGLTDDQTIGKYYSGKLKLKNNLFAGFYGTDLTSYPKGINPTTKTGTANTAVAGGLPSGISFDLSAKMVADGNTTQASSDGVLTSPYNSADYSSYSGMDYRPGTAAATGASFSDASLTPFLQVITDSSTPSVSNRSYCIGDAVTPLTATLSSTGVSLKWYTVATAGTAALVAPTLSTSVAGVKTYWVSQMNTSGTESARVAVTITVNALPTEVISVITGTGPVGSTSAIAVGKYVGTTSEFTYSVTAFADSSLSYLWSVPNGVNIVSGQGTNTVTVNYANVAPGAGSVGTINVQAVNTSGCKTLAKTLAITKALAIAPAALVMKNVALSATAAVTNYANYMGTTTALTLSATASVDASSYEWSLPSGVNLVFGGVTPVTTTLYYSAEPFLVPAANEAAITGTGAAGLKYFAVTYNTYNNVDVNGVATKIVTSTAKLKIISKLNTVAVPATAPVDYPVYGTVINSDKTDILVNFSGVTSASTTALYLGVKSKNGVGTSVISNVANVDAVASAASPATAIPGLYNRTYTETYVAATATNNNGSVTNLTNATSTWNATGYELKTDKLLKLTGLVPTAPTTLVLTNPASTTPATAVTTIGQFLGTTTSFTLTAGVVATATSYEWELPSGVVRTDAQGTNSTSNFITVNFSGVQPGTTSLYLGVKGKNTIGVSVTNNSAATVLPATTSTAKLLKITAIAPIAPATLVLTNPASTTPTTAVAVISQFLGTTTGFTLTAGVVATATSYEWELPTGVVRTDAQGTNSTSNVITVNFSGVQAGTTSLYLGVKSKNGFGVSITDNSAATVIPTTTSTAKLLKLTAVLPAVVATVTGQILLVNCGQSYNYTITAPLGASSYLITAPTGSVVTSANGVQGATANILTTTDLTFSVVYPSIVSPNNTLTVKSINGVGPCATFKTLTLTKGTACPGIVSNNTIDETSKVIVTEMYPNPTSDSFNVELSAAKANDVSVTVYSFDGIVVSSKNVQLSEGNNVINENLSSQRNGIYVVKVVNSSTGEVIIKKIVKQ